MRALREPPDTEPYVRWCRRVVAVRGSYGEPYTGTKPETVDTAKGTHLPDGTATPYLIGSILIL